ncbi:hypothetical protein FRC08_008744 [Ceratobasidium sp. 394]|nr:hypothetical protein FRC08_008744 [Ceratobasidium sp. 394]
MPLKPQKRAKNSPDSNGLGSPSLKQAQIPCNLEGFPSLPPELLYKIADYFPKIHVTDILMYPVRVGNYEGAPDYKSRFVALRSLSQTCRGLREFYLPLLWERFAVCFRSSPYVPAGAIDPMARKSKGMLESEYLWPYVRIVTVALSQDWNLGTVLPLFVRMLQSLPNIHTLQIPHIHYAMASALENAFRGSRFPSIRTVIMPNSAHEILRCCPGVESITCNNGDGSNLVSAVVEAGCNKLQVMQYVSPGLTVLKSLAEANPPLRCVRVKSDEAVIRNFATFPSLRTIEIECRIERSDIPNLVKVAKEALQACTEYIPATESSRARKNQSVDQDAHDDSVDLYTGPRVVRVRHMLKASALERPRNSPARFIPLKIEVFPAV